MLRDSRIYCRLSRFSKRTSTCSLPNLALNCRACNQSSTKAQSHSSVWGPQSIRVRICGSSSPPASTEESVFMFLTRAKIYSKSCGPTTGSTYRFLASTRRRLPRPTSRIKTLLPETRKSRRFQTRSQQTSSRRNLTISLCQASKRSRILRSSCKSTSRPPYCSRGASLTFASGP